MITNLLIVPESHNMNSALNTMRQIIDEQEYKYQKSLLVEDENNDLMILDEEYYYEQASTGILNKKITTSTHHDCIDMVDDIWGWKQEEKHEQSAEESKE